MAKYRATSPTYVQGVGIFKPDDTNVGPDFEVPDDTIPSRTWEPLDDAAKAAVEKYIDSKGGRKPAAHAVDEISDKFSTPYGVRKGEEDGVGLNAKDGKGLLAPNYPDPANKKNVDSETGAVGGKPPAPDSISGPSKSVAKDGGDPLNITGSK